MRRRLILHRNISSLKVFHFLLYQRSSILQVIYFLYRIQRFFSELITHACVNTWKSRDSIREKLHHCQRAETRDEHSASFQSSPKIDLWEVLWIQSNQRLRAIEFVDWPVPEKLDIENETLAYFRVSHELKQARLMKISRVCFQVFLSLYKLFFSLRRRRNLTSVDQSLVSSVTQANYFEE